jgi:hypothetical protein
MMSGAVTIDGVQKIVATGADENFSAHLPAKATPVSLRRKSTRDAGMQEENHEWLRYLIDGIGKRCAGRDPMSIPVEVLTASGHPRRRTRELVNAFAKGAGGDVVVGLEGIREYGDIRRHCLFCVDGNAAEVRRCTTIHCPFWPCRMGSNPHNPQRGRNPFARAAAYG